MSGQAIKTGCARLGLPALKSFACVLGLLIFCPLARAQRQNFELDCPGGTQPIVGPSQVTLNSATGKMRQNECVDANGNLFHIGAETFTNLNNIRFASQFPGADIGAKINAAIANLPANPIGGAVFIDTTTSGCQNFSTQIVIDRPVHLAGDVGGLFTRGTCLVWTGGATPAIVINGASGGSSGSVLSDFSLGNTGTGTVGIDIFNGQYGVILRNLDIEPSVAFSTAAVRIGNNTTGSATIDTYLENVRIGNQVIGLQTLFANDVQCVACHIYNSSTSNIQIGDSTHTTTMFTYYGGNIEQNTGTASNITVNNANGVLLTNVYTELTGNNTSVINVPNTATTARNIKWSGGYCQYNGVTGGTLLNSAFSGTTAYLEKILAVGGALPSALIANSAFSAISLRDITTDSNFTSISTGVSTGVTYNQVTLGGAVAGPFSGYWFADADQVNWRNHANSAWIPLTKDTSDRLTWNSQIVSDGSHANTLTIASGTATMPTAAIASGACGITVTVSASGVQTTDTIETAFNAAVGANPGRMLILQKWVTANNVNFVYCNPTAGSITPSAATIINWRVVR